MVDYMEDVSTGKVIKAVSKIEVAALQIDSEERG
jgi:hypothetical protein